MGSTFNISRRSAERFARTWTIAIDGEPSVYATVGTLIEGSAFVLPQSYHFEKAQWSLERAKQWVEDHHMWSPPPKGLAAMPDANTGNEQSLMESSSFTLTRVNREKAVVEDMKILGFKSAHGYNYAPDAVKAAVPLYEGAPANINHTGPDGKRDTKDRFGVFRSVRYVEGDGLRGNLHFNPKHPYAETFMWFAENTPEVLGLSQDAFGATAKIRGETTVTAIKRVKSVDVVASPATTKNLFESSDGTNNTAAVAAVLNDGSLDKAAKLRRISQLLEGEPKGDDMDLKTLTLAQLREERPDLASALTTDKTKDDQIKSLQESLDAVKKELDDAKAQAATAARTVLIETKLTESKLPDTAITPLFRETLARAKDEAEINKLIEDRASVAGVKIATGTGKPKSAGQSLTESTGTDGNQGGTKKDSKPLDAETFRTKLGIAVKTAR